MRRFGGTAGGVSTRFRIFEDRIRKLGAFGTWLCCVLLVGLGVSPAAVAQTTVTYIHTDALGSVVAESDANGNVIKRYDYEPYGAVVGGRVTDGPGYTGHVSDAATGLSYMQQRYMDPQLGMFLSVDPVTAYEQPVGQFNRYRYANGNPCKFKEPDGRAVTCNENRCSGEVNTMADALALPAILTIAYGGRLVSNAIDSTQGVRGLIRPTPRRGEGEGESSRPIA
ncbi:tRNA(Glu)-specific nuclease WapA precursor [compost metagenome]